MGSCLDSARDKWSYFTMTKNDVKIPVTSCGRDCMDETGCQTLSTGDEVYVTGYDARFTVTMYKSDAFRYSPCI